MKIGEIWRGCTLDNQDAFLMIINITYDEMKRENYILYNFMEGYEDHIISRIEFLQWFEKYTNNIQEFYLLHPEQILVRTQ